MATWLDIYGGTSMSTLQSAATAVATSASGRYADLQNIEGNMLAEVIMAQATAETRGVTVSWLTSAAATTTAYTAASTGFNIALTGKGMKIGTAMIPREAVDRFIRPKFVVNGSSVLCIRLYGRYKAVR